MFLGFYRLLDAEGVAGGSGEPAAEAETIVEKEPAEKETEKQPMDFGAWMKDKSFQSEMDKVVNKALICFATSAGALAISQTSFSFSRAKIRVWQALEQVATFNAGYCFFIFFGYTIVIYKGVFTKGEKL